MNRAVIKVIKNGPYVIKGLENITDSEGGKIKADMNVSSCRRGQSKNYPFCAGTYGISDIYLKRRMKGDDLR